MTAVLSTLTLTAWADDTYSGSGQIIPVGPGSLYYQLGGAESMPTPMSNSNQTIPLTAQPDVGLNYDCGVFDPDISVTNSMNDISNSFMAMTETVVDNATSAITELPMYIVAQADPNLYNMLNDGLAGANSDLKVSTKNCQVMQQNIQQGQNPYNDWLSVAMTSDWQQRMNKAQDGDSDSSDINQVSENVDDDNGRQGVPWVAGSNQDGTVFAGGDNEPAIAVVHDTVVAAYNVALQSGRSYDDTSAPSGDTQAKGMVALWPTPTLAADWVVNVVGDISVTTYPGGQKASTPGRGLLPETAAQAKTIKTELNNLVDGTDEATLAHLQKVSAPGVTINQAVITNIQSLAPVTQAIYMSRLSQEIATERVIDEALMARTLLLTGKQIPVIYNNKAAVKAVQAAIDRLTADIKDFQFNNDIRKQFSANSALVLLKQVQAQQAAHNQFKPIEKPENLAGGAVFPHKSGDSPT